MTVVYDRSCVWHTVKLYEECHVCFQTAAAGGRRSTRLRDDNGEHWASAAAAFALPPSSSSSSSAASPAWQQQRQRRRQGRRWRRQTERRRRRLRTAAGLGRQLVIRQSGVAPVHGQGGGQRTRRRDEASLCCRHRLAAPVWQRTRQSPAVSNLSYLSHQHTRWHHFRR